MRPLARTLLVEKFVGYETVFILILSDKNHGFESDMTNSGKKLVTFL